MQVYVCGYRGKGAGSKFIKWFTFGRFSHVSLVFDNGVGRPEEIEAIQGKGVHRQYFDATADNYTLFRVPCNAAQGEEAHEFASNQVGKKYDWFGIWGFVRRAFRQDPTKWFCSELVFATLVKIGVLLLRKKASQVNPDMLCASTVITPMPSAPSHWFKKEAA